MAPSGTKKKARPTAQNSRGFGKKKKGKVKRPRDVISRGLGPVMRGGSHVSSDSAPRVSGQSGSSMRLHIRTSGWSMARSASYAYTVFWDGTTEWQALGLNPLVTITSGYVSPILANSPALSMLKVFTKYAVRRLHVKFTPRVSYMDSGSVALAYRADSELSLTTYEKVKACSNADYGAISRAINLKVIDDDLRKPAATLWNVDPTPDNTTGKVASQQGLLIGATSSLEATARKIIGDLVFEFVIDAYGLQGDASPAALNIVMEQSLAERDAQRAIDEKKGVVTVYVDSSGRQITSAFPRVEKVPEPKGYVMVEQNDTPVGTGSSSQAVSVAAPSASSKNLAPPLARGRN